MGSRLQEVLKGKEDNYILPFMWQRGEGEVVIREEMARIDESGIKAVCIESRPHPDFLGPGWWADMDIIMDEARARRMRVWVFDDDHFPTGHAGGKLKEAPEELRRLFLAERHLDAIGPMKEASFPIEPWLNGGEALEAVVAANRDIIQDQLTGEMIDLMSRIHDGVLYWDIPEGYWRVFILVRTTEGADEKRRDYVNPLVADSVRVLIDSIHKAYFERYQDDFGGTFAGFFSDEPGFYNDRSTYDFESRPGKKGIVLPWSRDLLTHLEDEFGSAYSHYLPLLWHEAGEEITSSVRYAYMNVVSSLYSRHFSNQIGDWCREHQVEYIGHIIEDNNVHARLGCGPGHFFRSMSGQDMSGVDVVLWQLVPGFDEASFSWIAGSTDSEFFHYGLAKLASSLGHIDSKKKGRTMAEVFGAYGWAEGLKLMKWITDHMLVRGVNYFVPHAFSQKEYPDTDCPPHMYARGHNPQYRNYKILNDYTNRMSHLLSGGKHIATAAILYHAEAEWSGDSMYFHKPVKELMRSQIDCDVVPMDTLLDSATVVNSKLVIENEQFHCLIVPYAKALPYSLIVRLGEWALVGLPILFIDGLPARSSEAMDASNVLLKLSASSSVHMVQLSELVYRMKEMNYYEITVEKEQPYLRYYHYVQSGMDIFVFFNEHPTDHVHTNISLPIHEQVLGYDAFRNQVLQVNQVISGEGTIVPLQLSPYESIVLVTGGGMDLIEADIQWNTPTDHELELQGLWWIATAVSTQYPTFSNWTTTTELVNMSRPDQMPRFSGTFRYETEFEWQGGSQVKLDLGEVFETVEVWVNHQHAGTCICPPYRMDISQFIQAGFNTLTIEVTNTLVKERHDFFSRFAQQEPSGLLGPVRLLY